MRWMMIFGVMFATGTGVLSADIDKTRVELEAQIDGGGVAASATVQALGIYLDAMISGGQAEDALIFATDYQRKNEDALLANPESWQNVQRFRTVALFQLERYAEAIPLFEEAAERELLWSGAESIASARLRLSIASFALHAGDASRSAASAREAAHIAESKLGPDDAFTAAAWKQAGEAEKALGNSEDAYHAYSKAYRWHCSGCGGPCKDTAEILGYLCFTLKKWSTSSEYFLTSLETRRRLGTLDVENEIRLTYAIAYGKWSAATDLAAAVENLQSTVDVLLEISPEANLDVARTIEKCATLVEEQGLYDISLAWRLRAMEARSAIAAPGDASLLSALFDLANAQRRSGDYDAAAETYEKLAPLVGQSPDSEMDPLEELGDMEMERHHYEEARQAYLRRLAFAEKFRPDDLARRIQANRDIATVFVKTSNFQSALPFTRAALALEEQRSGEDSLAAAELRNIYGIGLMLGGQKEEGMEASARAIAQLREHLSDADPVLAKNLMVSGIMLGESGDYDSALQFYQQALEATLAARGREHSDYADALFALGSTMCMMGNSREARPVLEEAIAIADRVGGNKALAMYYYATTFVDSPQETLEKIRAAYETALQEEGPQGHSSLFVANALRNYSHLAGEPIPEDLPIEAFEENSISKANVLIAGVLRAFFSGSESWKGTEKELIANLEEARRIIVSSIGEHNTSGIMLSQMKAHLHSSAGHADMARSEALHERRLQTELLANVLAFASEQQRLDYLDLYQPYDSVTIFASHEDVARTVLRTKGIVLETLLAESALARSGSVPAATEAYEALAEIRKQMSAAPSSERPALEQKFNEAETALARASTKFVESRKTLSMEPEEISAALPEGFVVADVFQTSPRVELYGFSPYYCAVIYSHGESPKWISLGPVETINAEISSMRQALADPSSGDPALLDALKTLHTAIWQPLREAAGPAARSMIICPDGNLSFVPFAALIDDADRFVCESMEVRQATTARDILKETPLLTQETELVLVGDPIFGGQGLTGQDSDLLPGWSFPPLPGTRKEVESLKMLAEARAWQSRVLTGAAATESALFSLRSPGILHLATHGFFVTDERPEPSTPALLATRGVGGIRLTDDPEESPANSAPDASPFQSPMSRSGLALTGAQATLEAWRSGHFPPAENDGVLTALEASGLDLANTSLVVLSACRSSLGEVQSGEGILGLQRAFLVAGARNLLVSHWDIPDEETSIFMRDLYAHAEFMEDPAKALHDVKRKKLRQLADTIGPAPAVRVAGAFAVMGRGLPGQATAQQSPDSP